MKYRINIAVLFMLCNIIASAQDRPDYDVTNNLLEIYIMRQEWDSVIVHGEDAIRMGLDYSKLRRAVGIACFETGSYGKSITHLNKALQFNSYDELSLLYLDGAYAMIGASEYRPGIAGRIDEIRYGPNAIPGSPGQYFLAGTGFKFSTFPEAIKPMFWLQPVLRHRVSDKFMMTHAITFLNQNYLGYKYNQYQYFIGADIPAGPHISLSPGFHILSISGDGRFFEPPNERVDVDFKEISWMGHLTANIYTGRITLMPSLSYISTRIKMDSVESSSQGPGMPGNNVSSQSDESRNFVQSGLSAIWVPRAFREYIVLNAGYEMLFNNGSRNNIITAGVKAFLTKEFNIFTGILASNGISYFTEYKGMYLHNLPADLKFRWQLIPSLQVSDKVTWHITYQWEKHKEDDIKFNYNTFIIGIKFSL